MRIVAGRWRGRQLKVPPGLDIRPTQERVREALFSRLFDRVPGATVVDLFAGSGALGFEALSRGASDCVFVEREKTALKALGANLDSLAAAEVSRIVRGDVFDFLAGQKGRIEGVDLLFADPPYGELAARVAAALESAPGIQWREQAIRVIECALDDPDWPVPVGWERWQPRNYGKTRIVIEGRA